MFSERKHLERARKLLDSQDTVDLRYCALELRTSIELMCYDRLSLYIDEIPETYLKKWRPQDVINVMLECDPNSDKDCSIGFAKESSGGNNGPIHAIGASKGITKKFIQAHYHRLGQYLHAPTLADIKSGEYKRADEMRAELKKTFAEVESVSKTTAISNIGVFITFACQFCGFPNKRNKAALSEGKKVKCINPSCEAQFTMHDLEATVAQIKPAMTSWNCAKCNTDQFVLDHQIAIGRKLICDKCEANWEIGYALRATTKNHGPEVNK